MPTPAPSSDEDCCPAPPILASTLLELELDQKRNFKSTEPFRTGVKSLDANLPHNLWTSGKVIGIVSGRGEPKLVEQLIATHLASLAPPDLGDESNDHSVYIIVPPNSSIAVTIHDLLQARLPTRSGLDPFQLLDTVQIWQYLDIAGFAESLSEVSSRLHDSKGTSAVSLSPSKRHMLFLDGLCLSLESMQRRSGLVQANALAASLLRSVTHLSRSHPSLLVLVNLELRGDAKGGEEIPSAFSSRGTSIAGLGPASALQRTLLAGIDTVVLLHDNSGAGLNDGDLIVEVVKDREGASLGHWVAWPQSS